jgi:hypothetical protein
MSGKTEELVKMPRRLTAENGAKALLLGEFYEAVEAECPDCAARQFSAGCETCGGTGYIGQRVPVSWETIKKIYATAVDHLARPPEGSE